MKKCIHCGAHIADDSRFCSECGKEITFTNVCPHCGANIGEGDAFCQNCGRNLTDGSYANNSVINEQTQEDEEEPIRNWIPYILGAIALLAVCGGGWWFYNSSKTTDSKNDIAAVDTMAAEAVEEVVDTMNFIPVDTVSFSDTEPKDEVYNPSDDEVFSDTAAVSE